MNFTNSTSQQKQRRMLLGGSRQRNQTTLQTTGEGGQQQVVQKLLCQYNIMDRLVSSYDSNSKETFGKSKSNTQFLGGDNNHQTT